jgi:hypothetical protein
MPPAIGAAIRFQTSDPVPVAHMIGIRPTNIVATVMNFGRSRFAGPFHSRRLQIGECSQASFARRLLVREIEIQQHEDAGFGVYSEQRDQPDPYGEARVVAEQLQVPDGADGRERYGQQHDRRFHERPRVQVEKHGNDEQRCRSTGRTFGFASLRQI